MATRSLRARPKPNNPEANWLTPTFRFSYLIGNSVSQLGSIMLYMVVSFTQFALIYGMQFNINVPSVLLVMLAAIPCIYGLAFVFASLVITAKEAQNFVFLVRGLVMIFCGISYPVSVLPGWMQGFAAWLPQTYMIRAFRAAALANASLAQLLPDLIALVGFGAFWLAAGYVIFNWMERRARRTGAIGQY